MERSDKGGSGANSENAYYLFKSLGMSIPSGYALFDLNKVAKYINEGHIVYMRGRDDAQYAGHAWVADGCYFCVRKFGSLELEDLYDTYIHCDWGWGGNSNGYFSGEVFSAYIYDFSPMHYFAVKRK